VNILLLNYEYPPLGGGAANATFFLARSLVRLGHKPVVITTGYGTLPDHSTSDGFDVYRLRCGRRRADRSNIPEMALFTLRALHKAPSIAAAHHADAAIAFFTFPSGPVAARLKRLRGIPYVVSLRGGDVPGLVPELGAIHFVLAPWRRRILLGASRLVANDCGLARLAEAADGVSVDIQHNGVDCKVFSPASHASREHGRPFIWLYSGRLHTQKNIGLLLTEFRTVRAQSEPEGRLIIVGDGPCGSALRSRAEKLGVGDHVEWRGWVAKNEMAGFYRRCDALVNPSLYEGMPNVILEAMASGKPVVASDIPGNNTLVVHERTGLLFPLGVVGALSSAMIRIEADPQLAQRLGRAGRETAERDYSWDQAARKYLEFLHPTAATFTG